jgi:transposase-like protein
MKSRQRRSCSAEMKARIALEAIKEQKTIQEIASHYGVHPSQVTNWKWQAIQGAPELFADRRSQPDTTEEALKADCTSRSGSCRWSWDRLKKSQVCRVRAEPGTLNAQGVRTEMDRLPAH